MGLKEMEVLTEEEILLREIKTLYVLLKDMALANAEKQDDYAKGCEQTYVLCAESVNLIINRSDRRRAFHVHKRFPVGQDRRVS